MDLSVKSASLHLVAIENYGFAQCERHSRLGILAIAFLFARTVHKHLRTLHHETFDKPLILMTTSGAKSRIEVPQIQCPKARISKNPIACIRHASEVLT